MQNWNGIYASTTDNLSVITTLCNIFSYFQMIIMKTSLQTKDFRYIFRTLNLLYTCFKIYMPWQLITRKFCCDFKGQQPQQDSPKKSIDKGPAPNPPLSGEAQLKYENDRLKLALAQR